MAAAGYSGNRNFDRLRRGNASEWLQRSISSLLGVTCCSRHAHPDNEQGRAGLVWRINNITPYKASAVILRDRSGIEVFVVVVKGVYAIDTTGVTAVAQNQVEPTLVPKFLGDPATSSLEEDTDFVPTKPTTDILLHGHAFAPNDRPVRQIEVSLSVGPIKKSLRVYGDRTWNAGLATSKSSDPEPFRKMPLVYERAYGGLFPDSSSPHDLARDACNPAGIGAAGDLVGTKLPNIEPVSGSGARGGPAGFGPIARHWSPRRELAGTYDDDWKENRMPLPPHDFQDAFYQCAPQDQQAPAYLQGGEPVRLLNLTPSGPLCFTLPRVRLTLYATIAASTQETQPQLHTISLRPDVRTVTLTWHAAFPCPNQAHKIEEIIVHEKRSPVVLPNG
jgi:hypothetical protein